MAPASTFTTHVLNAQHVHIKFTEKFHTPVVTRIIIIGEMTAMTEGRISDFVIAITYEVCSVSKVL
jgi:hypothetical protein